MKIFKIPDNYLEDDFIKLPLAMGVVSNLLISPNEIIYLNIGKKILINKSSPYMDIESHKYDIEGYRYVDFKYNENYLFIQNNPDGQRAVHFYFTKEQDKTLCFINSIYSYDIENGELKNQIFNRQEIESIFDSKKYDSMYITDVNGKMIFARNKQDKEVISKKLIPSDEEIIDMEYENKQFTHDVVNLLFRSIGEKTNDKKVTKKKIEDVKNVPIYTPSTIMLFAHLLIISQNNEFKVYEFSLEFLSKDTFKLMSREIIIKNKNYEIKEIENFDIKKLIK